MSLQSSILPGVFDIRGISGDTCGRLMTYTKTVNDAEVDADEVADYDIVACYAVVRGTQYDFTVTRPDLHQINIAFTAAETEEMGVGEFPWALVWQEPGDTVRTAHSGYLILERRA